MVDSSSSVDLSEETDIDLLDIVSSFKNEDIEISNRAFEVFAKRYESMIWKICVKTSFGHCNFETLKNELYSQTLINIYSYCGGFSVSSEKDPQVIKKRICGWIIQIIKHAHLELITTDKNLVFIDDISPDTKTLRTSKYTSKDSYNMTLVHQALAQLSERDRDIVMTYWRYYERGDASQAKNLPSEILNELVNRHNTTTVNIRQIISRGMKKIIEYLKIKIK